MSKDESLDSPTERSTTDTIPSLTHSLDGLTDFELSKKVDDLEVEVIHLELENQIFENFLRKNDPSLLIGMAQILELANKVQNQTQSTLTSSIYDRRDTTDSLRVSSRRTESVLRFATSTTASTSERGPRINLSQKMDLAMREMEEMQTALQKFIQESHRTKCNLKAELEEISIRETEVTEARDIFEQKIVIEGVDSLTQRIPAEKFIRYMEEWLKSAESTIEKMRLRTSTLKATFIRLSNQLIQKEELGETIDAVDFDKLQIENQHLAEEIEQKNNHLLELKRMTGTANLVLSTNKHYLQKQVLELNTIKDSIKFKEEKIVELDKEAEAVEGQVNKEKEKYEKILDLRENYRVPSIMEYVKTKATLSELKKNLKILERKNHIQQFALSTCVRKMKKLTGLKNSHPSWFEYVEKPAESESSLNIDIEEKPSISSKPS